LKKEIDELWESKSDCKKFLDLLSNKYVSYKKEKVKFKDDDFKAENIKKTLIKTLLKYHPDKK